MKELIIYSIACYSLTFGFIESPHCLIVEIRNFIKNTFSEKLIKCYHCSGFWISFILSPYIIEQYNLNYLYSFLFALYGGGISYLIHIIEDYIYYLRYEKGDEKTDGKN